MERIFLIGYMGSGKTTLGRKLADHLGFGFVDMDAFIESKKGKTVSQIFEEEGEVVFRKIERECLHEVSELERVVISTGGGAPCFFDNMEYMNHNGLTVYLKWSATTLFERFKTMNLQSRPLLSQLKGEELYQFISRGLKIREPFYSKALVVLNETQCDSLEEIISSIKKYMIK